MARGSPSAELTLKLLPSAFVPRRRCRVSDRAYCPGPRLLVLRLKAVVADYCGVLLQARDRQERLEASGGRGRRRRVRALGVSAAAPG